jgi:AcrR family transcriptional regulator
MTLRIRDGLVFKIPEDLPRGRHELTREQVLAAQRERLMIAITELMAEQGYRNVGVREIAARAGVSRTTFYECFDDKEACAFAAYDRGIEFLAEGWARDAQPAQDWDSFVLGLVETFLRGVQQDPVASRAFQVDIDAVGPEARRRRRQALFGLAQYIRGERERLLSADRAPVPMSAYLGAVYAVRQISADALDQEPSPDLVALAPQLASWMSQMLLGEPAAEAGP